jgi:hypothetical protein
MTSATEIRGAWPNLNEKRKTALVMSLYPATQKNPKLAATVVKMLDTAMGAVDESALGDLPRPNKRNQFKSLHRLRKQHGLDEQSMAEGEGGLGQVAGIGINGKQFNFSIKDLIAKAQNYPVKKLNPQLFVKQLADRHEDPKQTAARAQSADLQYPIIVVQDGNTLMIADGTHRAQKAIMNKLPAINAHVIPVKDMAEFTKQGVAEGSGGNWYIRINGKILNDTKFKPEIFSSEDEARSHAMKLADKKRIPLSQIKLTKSWMDAPEQGVAEGLNEFAQGDFNGGDDSNDLQLYLNVAKKLNMKKYKPSTAHNLIAKKMAELVDAVDDEKVDWARHMARKAQGLPSMLDQQGVAEGPTADQRAFFAGADSNRQPKWRPDPKTAKLNDIQLIIQKYKKLGADAITQDEYEKLKLYRLGKQLYEKASVPVVANPDYMEENIKRG